MSRSPSHLSLRNPHPRVFSFTVARMITWYLDFEAMQAKAAKYRRHANNGQRLAMLARDAARKVAHEAQVARLVASIDDVELEALIGYGVPQHTACTV